MTINLIQPNFQLKYQAPNYQASEKISKNNVSFTSDKFQHSIAKGCNACLKYVLPITGGLASVGGTFAASWLFTKGLVPNLAATIKPGALGAKDIIYENHNLTWMGGGIIIFAGVVILATSIVRGLIQDHKSQS